MDIKFVGTWGFADLELWNSSAILNFKWNKILIDCGADTYQKLSEKLMIDSVEYVLITHLHWDHIWSLFHLATHKKRIKNNWEKIKILYIDQSHKNLLKDFFKHRRADYIEEEIEFVDFWKIGWITSIDTFWQHAKWIQSYAYYFEENNEWIYYSWDLWVTSTSQDFLKNIDNQINLRIFHEVWLGAPNSVHCHYLELQEMLEIYDMYCYHCDHTQRPDDCTLRFVAEYPEFML